MRILVACEFSGRVRDAFLRHGQDAISCDLDPTETPGPHIRGDVRDILGDGWDLLIAHPPCTYLSSAQWSKWQDKTRWASVNAAADFFMTLYDAPVSRVCVENPAGVMSRWFRKPDQYVHPYWFGDAVSKRTGLWLRGLSPLVATDMATPLVSQNNVIRNSHERSRTYSVIADAMADQWQLVTIG